MSEILLHTPEMLAENEGSRLYGVLDKAQQIYFINEWRNESRGQFEIYDKLPSRILRETTGFLNRKIHEGYDIVVFDFPEEDKLRAQAFTQHHYVRKMHPRRNLPAKTPVLQGDFSTRLRTLQSDKGVGLSFDVRNVHGSRGVFKVAWDESKDPSQRIAVMTHKNHAWGVILDFRIEAREGEAAWKANSVLHSH